MSYKLLTNLAVACLVVSCNIAGPDKTDTKVKTSLDSVMKSKDSIFRVAYSTEKIKSLLSHFPDDKNFPVIIDSTYMANVVSTTQAHDSLGTNEVKMLVRFWFDDELLASDSNDVCDFYKIDSLKLHHKFTGQYIEGMPTYANAYALQQIWMKEETLLVWALVLVQEDADPVYTLTTVYYTILNNSTILEVGIIGSLMTGADPPGVYQTILSSTLTSDGKLLLDKNEFSGDIDSLTAETKHTHYEYLIHQGYTKLQSKKEDAPKNFKMKAEK